MSNRNSSQPSSPPPVEHYDVIYEDDVHSLAALMAHDKREYWTLMLDVNADETINQAKLDYLREHIAALQEEYALLTKTIKALATTGIHAAKHPADVRGPQRKKFAKIREDHGVATLESSARSKQAAIKKYKELYRAAKNFLSQKTSNRKKTENPRQKRIPLGPPSNFEAAIHERRNADQPDTVSDVNLQDAFTEGDDAIDTTATAPDLSGQPNVVADVSLQGFVTDDDELGSSTNAAPDQSDQSYVRRTKTPRPSLPKVMRLEPGKFYAATLLSLQVPPSDEVRDSTDAALDQYDQPNEVTAIKLQGTTSREFEVSADGNLQDFDEHKVTGSADATSDQYDQFEDQSPDSANQFVKAATNSLADIANLGRAETTGRSLEELEEKLPPDLRKEVFRRRTRNRNSRQTSNTHSSKLEPMYQDLNEPSSDSEADDTGPDQDVEGSEDFDDDTKYTQTKTTSTYAVLSNKENGTHRTTLLECVKVTAGNPTGKSQQCETVLLLDSASDHTYIKQSLCQKLHLPSLGPAKLSIATFLSTDEIPVDTCISQLRIGKSNGKTFCLKAPVMPDQFVGQMRTAFVRPEHIMELGEGSCGVCPSTVTPEILIGRDLRHMFEVMEEYKPLPSGFLLAHSNVGTMLVGSGRANKPADQSELAQQRSFFIRAKADDVSIDQLLESPLADGNLAQNTVARFRHQLEEKEPHKMHSVDQMGIEPPSHPDEDNAVHQRIRDNIRWVEGRNEVGLPWRTSDAQPSSSEELSDNCNKGNLLAEYDKALKDYLTTGIFSKFLGRPSHYLSHHAVIKRSSSTTRDIPVLNPTTSMKADDARDHTYRPGRPTAVDRVVGMRMEHARRLQTVWSTWHESILLGSLKKGTRPDKTTSNNRPKGQTAHALVGQISSARAQILVLIESSDGVVRTATIRLHSGTVSHITLDLSDELELDYDEELPTSDQRPVYGQDQRKRLEVNEFIVLPSDSPMPVLDSHLHADEVESYARDLQGFPLVYATWSQDQTFRLTSHDQFQCRVTTATKVF
ncbi:Pao retrotransposon peptidase family protein [Aphelenchoides avenae]|nr:Pao retrotransposon peptidase family protein [Aphelenchus avenae]